ncbi:MAG: hypothetical protein V1884_02820 [Candidatus Omnitrophota bacterium]
MRRKDLDQGLGLVLLLSLALLVTSYSLLVTDLFAEEESYTITTYYPSPYGSYNELQTNKFAVGDTNGDGKVTTSDQPPKTGSLYVAESVIYKPKSGDPATWNTTNARQGELTYSSSQGAFYGFNGSTWVAQGGGATYFLSCNACPTGSTEVANAKKGTSLQGATATFWVTQGTYSYNFVYYTGINTQACCSSGPYASTTSFQEACIKICKY